MAPTNSTPSIFISYRRTDAPGHAGRLYDWLQGEFGEDKVFFDVSTIRPGIDFPAEVRKRVRKCTSLVAVIGPNWNPASLQKPDDYVRIELEDALRAHVHLVPVLVWDGQMPAASDLPESLKPFARVHACSVRDLSWKSDVVGLVEELRHPSTGPLRKSQDRANQDHLADILEYADYYALGSILQQNKIRVPPEKRKRAELVARRLGSEPHGLLEAVMGVEQLKNACRALVLSPSGRKHELVRSLIDSSPHPR